jgi:hypothetical protein
MQLLPATPGLIVPDAVLLSPRVKQWTEGGNDHAGDCVEVCGANKIGLDAAMNGKQIVLTPGECLYVYSELTKYSPLNKATDLGTLPEDMLSAWQKDGWPTDSECRLRGAWTVPEPRMKEGAYLLGGLLGRAMLPFDGEDYVFNDSAIGTLKGQYGHMVFIPDVSDDKMAFVTWGDLQPVSRAWWREFGTDLYGVLLPDWPGSPGVDAARLLGLPPLTV